MPTRFLVQSLALPLLLLTLLAAPLFGADNWVEVHTAHFTVTSNAGEKEARKIADQFEQVRQMFHLALAAMRVDQPQPVLIIAVKNEGNMKLYLPDEYEVKGHVHAAGIYQGGQDKDYVILRLDTEGENPFHTLYHEYMHALIRLNFNRMPLWLNEGLAEFFGNSTIGDKEAKLGTPDSSHLYILGQNKLIPVESLLQIDNNSPFYNEANRASVFYAESWALTHYLMMDPDAQKRHLLNNFLNSYQKSGDQVAAAREAFGDLNKFSQRISAYARQPTFYFGKISVTPDAANQVSPARAMAPAEVLAIRGDFLTHHNLLDKAKPVIDEALANDPNLPLAHEALGFYFYRKQQMPQADAEMEKAATLGSTSFIPLYYHGLFTALQGGSPESSAKALQLLTRVIELNPQFAPAYEALARAYPHTLDGQKLAVNAAFKSVQMDPGQLHYSINLAYLLLNNNRDAEALTMIHRIRAAAEPSEKGLVDTLQSNYDEHQRWLAQVKEATAAQASAASPASANSQVAPSIPVSGPTNGQPTTPSTSVGIRTHDLAIEGVIADADCSALPEVDINIKLPGGETTFRARDFSSLPVTTTSGSERPTTHDCSTWTGRKVKLWFNYVSGKDYAGEITRIDFF